MSKTSPYLPPPLPVGAHFPRPSSPYIPVLQPEAPSDSDLGKRIGNFELVTMLGQGGMGTVYLAKHVTIEKQVAIKTLRSELSSDQQLVARFFREARLLSRLRHPGIVEIYDSGSSPELGSYLIMEYLDGESLQEYLQRQGAIQPEEAIRLICQILEALVVVHGAGILHRDLKPSNIYLVRGGLQVKLLDFGISKLLEPAGDELTTTTGYIVGTPAYLSPEQAIGRKNITASSDLYAVGTILFEMVTGRRPFCAKTPQKMLVMQQVEPPPPPSVFVSGLPSGLERVILHCLEKNPEARPQSAQALLRALRDLSGASEQSTQEVPQVEETEVPLAFLETIRMAPEPQGASSPAELSSVAPALHERVARGKGGHLNLSSIWVLGAVTVTLFACILGITAAL